VLAVEGTFPLALGSEVRLRARQLPLPFAQTWHVRVVALEEPVLIVDELLSGPFAAWHQEHRFAELPGGRTQLTDHVEYRLPLGALGRLADALFAHRLMDATFRSRQARTRDLLASGQAPRT
jgi:uncharacterized protein